MGELISDRKEAGLRVSHNSNCTQNFKNGKDFSFPRPEDIDAYSKKVKNGRIKPTISACPVCNTFSEYFKRHDARPRQFYVTIEQMIQIVYCMLIVWRCPACNKRILQYPDFALPYKRYTRQTILDYSAKYLANDSASYESVIRQCPIGYREYQTDERQLAKSSLWQWISSLGMPTLLRQAQLLILQADPACAVSRSLGAMTIPVQKYTTFTRKNLLVVTLRQACMKRSEKYGIIDDSPVKSQNVKMLIFKHMLDFGILNRNPISDGAIFLKIAL